MIVMDNWFTRTRLLKNHMVLKVYAVETVKSNMVRGLPSSFAKIKGDKNHKEMEKIVIGRQGQWVFDHQYYDRIVFCSQ